MKVIMFKKLICALIFSAPFLPMVGADFGQRTFISGTFQPIQSSTATLTTQPGGVNLSLLNGSVVIGGRLGDSQTITQSSIALPKHSLFLGNASLQISAIEKTINTPLCPIEILQTSLTHINALKTDVIKLSSIHGVDTLLTKIETLERNAQEQIMFLKPDSAESFKSTFAGYSAHSKELILEQLICDKNEYRTQSINLKDAAYESERQSKYHAVRTSTKQDYQKAADDFRARAQIMEKNYATISNKIEFAKQELINHYTREYSTEKLHTIYEENKISLAKYQSNLTKIITEHPEFCSETIQEKINSIRAEIDALNNKQSCIQEALKTLQSDATSAAEKTKVAAVAPNETTEQVTQQPDSTTLVKEPESASIVPTEVKPNVSQQTTGIVVSEIVPTQPAVIPSQELDLVTTTADIDRPSVPLTAEGTLFYQYAKAVLDSHKGVQNSMIGKLINEVVILQTKTPAQGLAEMAQGLGQTAKNLLTTTVYLMQGITPAELQEIMQRPMPEQVKAYLELCVQNALPESILGRVDKLAQGMVQSTITKLEGRSGPERVEIIFTELITQATDFFTIGQAMNRAGNLCAQLAEGATVAGDVLKAGQFGELGKEFVSFTQRMLEGLKSDQAAAATVDEIATGGNLPTVELQEVGQGAKIASGGTKVATGAEVCVGENFGISGTKVKAAASEVAEATEVTTLGITTDANAGTKAGGIAMDANAVAIKEAMAGLLKEYPEGLEKTFGKHMDIINETFEGPKFFKSKFIVTEDEALDIGRKFLGDGYIELDSGVFRSKDGLRQFRIDDNSLRGLHDPHLSHAHLEVIRSNKAIIINHIILRN